MFKRELKLGIPPKESFFLWGPRQSGKTTLLKSLYPDALWYDLLKTDTTIRLLKEPYLFREEILAKPETKLVIVDEIQKVPALLDEIHWLIENTSTVFGMCGSSARKVRRGHANLLGGRAIGYQIFGLVSKELGDQFDLEKLLNRGYLPSHYLGRDPRKIIRSYINDYLKEEIANEGLVRNLPSFSEFLNVAALSDAEIVNMLNIARDCGVSSPTVKEYFQILVDTLLGHYVEAYKKRPKRRIIHAPKFYFNDVGVVNSLAKRGELVAGSSEFGKAFENWVFHELKAYSHYSEKYFDITYWKLTSGFEVDFIIGDMDCAIEVKSSAKIHGSHLKGLKELAKEHKVEKSIIVSNEKVSRKKDGILILSVEDFKEKLWSGKLI